MNGNRYLLTALDNHTKCPKRYGYKSKNPVHTAKVLQQDAVVCGGYADEHRTDNGGEWCLEFDEEIPKHTKKRTTGVPGRAQTDSRHERFHQTLIDGIRVSL